MSHTVNNKNKFVIGCSLPLFATKHFSSVANLKAQKRGSVNCYTYQ
jgi:hypothetical protein